MMGTGVNEDDFMQGMLLKQWHDGQWSRWEDTLMQGVLFDAIGSGVNEGDFLQGLLSSSLRWVLHSCLLALKLDLWLAS